MTSQLFAGLPGRLLKLSGQPTPPRDLLCRAAVLGSARSVQVLMAFARNHIDPNDPCAFMYEDKEDTLGWSPLHIACHRGYHDVIDALLPHVREAMVYDIQCGKSRKTAFDLTEQDAGSRSLLRAAFPRKPQTKNKDGTRHAVMCAQEGEADDFADIDIFGPTVSGQN